MKEQITEYVLSLYRDIPTAVYEGLLSVLFLGAVVIIACYGSDARGTGQWHQHQLKLRV